MKPNSKRKPPLFAGLVAAKPSHFSFPFRCTLMAVGMFLAVANPGVSMAQDLCDEGYISVSSPSDLAFLKDTSFPAIHGHAFPAICPFPYWIEYIHASVQRYSDFQWWNGSAWTASDTPLAATTTSNDPFSDTDFDVTANLPSGADLPEGSYEIFVDAQSRLLFDTLGVSIAIKVTIDRTPPTISIFTPANLEAFASFPGVGGSASDSSSGLAQVKLVIQRVSDTKYWTGGGWGGETYLNAALNGASWSFNTPVPSGQDLTEGDYLLVAFAYDNAGNASYSNTQIRIDRTPPPAPSISVPANNAIVAGLPSIEGTTVDDPSGSGIDSVFVSLQRSSDGMVWNGLTWTVLGSEGTQLSTQLSRNVWSRTTGLPPTADLADGAYTLTAFSYDRAGNLSPSTSVTFTNKQSNPVIAFDSPINLKAFVAFPTLTGKASAGPGLQISAILLSIYQESTGSYWGNGLNWIKQGFPIIQATSFFPNSGNWAYSTLYLPTGTNARDGMYQVTVGAFDNGGGSTYLTSTITIDTVPPVAGFSVPSDGASLNSLSFISGTASDNPGGSGIDHVSVLILRESDGLYWSTGNNWASLLTAFLPATVSGNQWSLSSNLPAGSDLAEGNYEIKVLAYDAAGNSSRPDFTVPLKYISIRIDKTPPLVTFDSPASGSVLSSLSSFSGTAADNGGSGLARLDVTIQRNSDGRYWNGASWGASATTFAPALSGNSWSLSGGLPSGTNLNDGNYTLSVTASDGARNSTAAAVTVTVDATAPPAPSVPRLVPGSDTGISSTDNLTRFNGSGTNRLIFFGTAEAGSRVQLFVNGQLLSQGKADATNGLWLIDANTNFADGAYAVTARAADAAGNLSPLSAPVNVIIDTTPPVSSVGSLPAVEASTTFSVCWSGTDVGSGIVAYDIYVSTNNGPWTSWLVGTTNTCATFSGRNGTSYGFYSLAQDVAGNIEQAPSQAQAQTQTPNPSTPPILAVVPDVTVNELTLLIVTNTAAPGSPAIPLGYSLLNAPPGVQIDVNGIITWTPSQAESPSTNVITTVVAESAAPSLAATNSFTVIVREVNVAPTLAGISPKAVNELTLLTVTNSASEPNIHAVLSYALVNPPTGASIDPDGVMTWKPDLAQSPGTNVITTVVTATDLFDMVNPHLSATNSFMVVTYAPTLATITNYTVNVGQTLNIACIATDNDPTRSLSFSLDVAPIGAAITPIGGMFSWRPLVSDANTTNVVQVQVTDNNVPPLSASQSFTVFVNSFTPPNLTLIAFTNGGFSITITGPAGPDYVILRSTNLVDWSILSTNASPGTPINVSDSNAGAITHEFYRVRVGP